MTNLDGKIDATEFGAPSLHMSGAAGAPVAVVILQPSALAHLWRAHHLLLRL